MIKRRAAVLALSVGLCLNAGCARYEETSVTAVKRETSKAIETEVIRITEAATEPENGPEYGRILERVEKDGKVPSYLTGEMTDAAIANRRPIAIMISNDKAALPHYGMSHAGVIYEAPAEGGMNRYMAVMEDYDGLDRIGSVRSCRTYYTFFAREFAAIYAHFGQSKFAVPYLMQMEHLNGIEGKGSAAFYRSSDKKAPHNAYASADRLREAIGAMGYSQEYPESYEGHFLFAGPEYPVTLEDGFEAAYVRPGYPINNPWFEYHGDDGLYYRYQYGGAHDDNEGQLAVKNIIFQYCNWSYYSPSEYLDIDLLSPNGGYYFTNGKGKLIGWKKDGPDAVTKYYDENGQEILLNPGKTWICIILKDQADKAEFYGEQTE